MKNYNDSEIINIGVGQDIPIRDLALLIKEFVGFEGELQFDASEPDGTARKLLDVSKLNVLGWKAQISLADGIRQTYTHFKSIN
jgi:GDP-L-fucose synthase